MGLKVILKHSKNLLKNDLFSVLYRTFTRTPVCVQDETEPPKTLHVVTCEVMGCVLQVRVWFGIFKKSEDLCEDHSGKICTYSNI